MGFNIVKVTDRRKIEVEPLDTIRDALISILSSKTVTELADTKSREMIRRQILKVVNQICQPARAEAIYFVDFVLQ